MYIEKEITRRLGTRAERKEMKKIYFDGETAEYGCYVQGAMVVVSDDWTMIELVNAIKEAGYRTFKLDTMRKLAKVW